MALELDIVSFALTVIAMGVVTAMLLIGLAGLVDKATIVRCALCSRWMLDTRHPPAPQCLRCRVAHSLHLPTHGAT
ncbi:MAG: hypothetical protein HOQ24_13290 [Mycobacteriaceae bacterium]|nr:hypothetical protein [Mycobacteriaceae bacterium]